jgi:hypothetical protein
MHLSVVVSSGGVTLAWGYANPAAILETVRVAYGPLIGRWSPSRTIGRFWGVAPFFQYPQLTIAPDGEALVAWNACKSSASCGFNLRGVGVDVAWRAPGHGFGAPQLVGAAPLGAAPQFDARGTAYLASSCSGRVVIAQADSNRFSRSVVVAPGPVSEITLSLSGAGRGLAAWVAGACSLDEAEGNTPGPVFVSVLRSGKFGEPKALTSGATRAVYSHAVAVPAGGTVTWSTDGGPNGLAEFSVQIGPEGVAGEAQSRAGEVTALTADGGGDIIFASAPVFGPVTNTVFVQPVGGGADQLAPPSSGQVIAAAPTGHAAALAWYTGSPRLALSVWRP